MEKEDKKLTALSNQKISESYDAIFANPKTVESYSNIIEFLELDQRYELEQLTSCVDEQTSKELGRLFDDTVTSQISFETEIDDIDKISQEVMERTRQWSEEQKTVFDVVLLDKILQKKSYLPPNLTDRKLKEKTYQEGDTSDLVFIYLFACKENLRLNKARGH